MIEYILFSLKNLSYRKTRAFLTLLGVIIGITAVVSMVSIGTGMKVALEEELKVIGTDKIIVQSKQVYGGATTNGLIDEDSEAIERVVGVGFVSPMYNVISNAEFRGEEKTITLWGLSPEKAERTFAGTSGYKLFQGRWLRKGDRGKIAIGFGVHDDFFERKVNVGNNLLIKGQRFKVIGIFRKTGDRDSDYTLYADIAQVRALMEKEDAVTLIVVRIKEGYDINQVGKRVENLLEKRREEKDFAVLTPAQIVEQVGQAFKVVQIVFGGIAAISLLVGAIGIANTMIMNVLERTQEIGVMKAIGASKGHIMKIFLFESGVIGLVGGGIGIFLGFIISKLINIAAEKYLGEGVLFAVVSPEMAALAISFSFIIGIGSGVYPAYRAANLDPVEALKG